jgi:hypothetical protein
MGVRDCLGVVVWLSMAAACTPQSVDRATVEPTGGGGAARTREPPLIGGQGSGAGGSGGGAPRPSGAEDAGGGRDRAGSGAMSTDASARQDAPPATGGPPDALLSAPDGNPGDSLPPRDSIARDSSPLPDRAREEPLPPLSDAVAASCNSLPAWRAGVRYQSGADITNLAPRQRFECRPWPYTPWCSLSDYEPGRTKYWPDAWIDRGRCP